MSSPGPPQSQNESHGQSESQIGVGVVYSAETDTRPSALVGGNAVIALHSSKTVEYYDALLLRSAWERNRSENGAEGSCAAPFISRTTLKMAQYIRERSVLGCQLLTALDYDADNLFTRGLRPELRRESFILLEALDNELLLCGRIRQQFNSEVDADSHKYALLVFVLEVWRPGSMSISVLCSAGSACAEGKVTSSGGALSRLLVRAQGAVSELRSDFRDAMSRGPSPAAPLWLNRSASCNYYVSMIKDALAVLRQRVCSDDTAVARGVQEGTRTPHEMNSEAKISSAHGGGAWNLPSREELATELHSLVAAHYSTLPLLHTSTLTQRVVRYVAWSEHSEAGCRSLVSLHGDLRRVFTPGSRPEVKREYRVLFGWHGAEVLRPSYRYRQQFSSTKEADECLGAILTLLVELWRPRSMSREALERVCGDRDGAKRSGGALSACYCILREVVWDVRFDALRTSKEAVDNGRDKSRVSSSEPAAGCMKRKRSPSPPSAAGDGSVSRASRCGGVVVDGHTAALGPRVGFPHRYSVDLENRSDLLPETRRAVHFVLAHFDKCAQELSEVRRTDGACLFTPSVCGRYRLLFGWHDNVHCGGSDGGGDRASSSGASGRRFSVHDLCHISSAYRLSVYLHIVELWEPGSVSLELLQCGAHVNMEDCREGSEVREMMGELQTIVMNLRRDYFSK